MVWRLYFTFLCIVCIFRFYYFVEEMLYGPYYYFRPFEVIPYFGFLILAPIVTYLYLARKALFGISLRFSLLLFLSIGVISQLYYTVYTAIPYIEEKIILFAITTKTLIFIPVLVASYKYIKIEANGAAET